LSAFVHLVTKETLVFEPGTSEDKTALSSEEANLIPTAKQNNEVIILINTKAEEGMEIILTRYADV
jgi:hypothetical protein